MVEIELEDRPAEAAKEMARWPLAHKLHAPKAAGLQAFGFDSSRPVRKAWWSYRMYKNADNKLPEILYSKTKEESEKIAKQFLNEPVVGFDMEWPWDDWKKEGLQNKIGLIQIASESKIGLVHIGLHPGKTTEDIIAPSLKKLIEDPSIGKLGVSILHADFARLRRFFHLEPRGAVELSHLYRLVKFGGHKPEYVSTKMVSLARIVEDQLGYPLDKGDVRTSNWSTPLSRDQIDYAAGDAYAGYMLYHCLNYKRLQMKRVPPLPVHAETYQTYKMSGINPLRLDGKTKDGSIMTSEIFFGVAMNDSTASMKSAVVEQKLPMTPKPKAPEIPKELVDVTSQALYQELVLCRTALAVKAGIPAHRVTTNNVLVALALQRPADKAQLLSVKGVGTKTQESYGQAWLDVIAKYLDPDALPVAAVATDSAIAADSKIEQHIAVEPPSTPVRSARRTRKRDSDSQDSSPAFGSPVQRTPQLHTGLSFTMAETNLDAEEADTEHYESDVSLPSLDFGETPSLPTPQLKRKRTESPRRSAPQRLQHATRPRDEISDPPRSPNKITAALNTPDKITAAHIAPQKITAAPQIPLTPTSRITRNKLLAFSKLVTRKMAQRPVNAPPIVSERTLSLIVVRSPQTMEELERIPGIDALILACQQTGMDLLKNVVKFSRGAS